MLEPGKTILFAVAAIGYLVAGLVAFALISLVGFFGVGLIGLFALFMCMQIELDLDGGSNPFGAQFRSRGEMTGAERAGRRHEQWLANRSTRLFKYVGIGLTVIGFGGFLYELGAFAP